MAGHSKWANIKHRKEAQDKKRSKVWTKLIREITVAAREGGGDASANPRLRLAMDKAIDANKPKDTIERAIKRGAVGTDTDNYEEIRYEGYGPGGVAVMVDCMTDNRNRTVADIRHYFAKSGGNLGEFGCVSWMFDKKGLIQIDKSLIAEEKLMEMALEAGAEDVVEEETEYQVLTSPEDFDTVRTALEEAGLTFLEASITRIPQNTVEVTDEKNARSLMKLLENLEDHDDVQNVNANFDIDDDLMEQIS